MRERRLLVTAAAAAAAVAFWLLAAAPVQQARARMAAEAAELRTRLIAGHALLTRGKDLGREVDELERSVKEREAGIFTDEQPSLLGARLQKLYKDMAERSGLTVKSEQILETEVVGGISVVPVEITVTGATDQVDGFLAAIGADGHRLTVERLSIRVANILKPVQVTAVARISGYLLPQGAP